MSDATDPRPAAALLVAGLLAAGLGYVMGFNQLATQSPVDAVLPVALLSVGLAGLLAMVRLSLLAPADPGRRELGFAHLAVGVAAAGAVLWHWGTTTQAVVVGIYGLWYLPTGVVGVVAHLRRSPWRRDAVVVGLDLAQAGLLVGFAWAALADAGVHPFG